MRLESCLSVKVESSSSQLSINVISSPSSFDFLPHFFLISGGAGVSPKAIAQAHSSSAWASWTIQSTELVLIS
jgi:purine nucleoside permease